MTNLMHTRVPISDIFNNEYNKVELYIIIILAVEYNYNKRLILKMLYMLYERGLNSC